MTTLELVTFRTPGTSAEDFLNANTALNHWLKRQPGFMARHLACRKDGSWVDVVLWEDGDAAQRVAARLMEEMAQSPAMTAIDPGSIDMSHAEIRISVT